MFGKIILTFNYWWAWLSTLPMDAWIRITLIGIILVLLSGGVRGIGKFIACMGGTVLLLRYVCVLI